LHEEMDKELAQHDDLEWLIETLKSERLFSLRMSAEQFGRFPMEWQGKLLQADILIMYEKLLPELRKPWYESAEARAELANQSYSTPLSTTMIELLFPAIEAAHVAANRNLVMVRSVRILNALKEYQQTHDREASRLEDLDLPETATIDPFDGKPLKLKQTDKGWVIYSVYTNGTDDGGEFEDMADVGLAPPGYPGGR